MTKLKITHGQLQQLKEAAQERFKSSHNQAVDSSLYPVLCTILEFVSFAKKHDICIELDYLQPAYYESVDSE